MRLTTLALLFTVGCYSATDEVLDTTAAASGASGVAVASSGTSGAATTSHGAASSSAGSGGASHGTASSSAGSGVGSTSSGASGTTLASSTSGTTSRGTVASSGFGATTNGGGATGAGTTTGGSTSGGCQLTDCPTGLTEIRGSLTDLCTGTQVTGTIKITDQLDPNVVATTSASGDFYFCVMPGTQLAIAANVSGYVPSLFATIDAQESSCLGPVPVVCEEALSIVPFELPGYDATDPGVLVVVRSLSGAGACQSVTNWSFSLQDGTVGTVDAGWAAVSASGVTSGDKTGAEGVILAYNIDPALVAITGVVGTQPSTQLPDGGTECPNIGSGLPYQLSGGLELAQGVLSIYPYVIP